MLATPKDYDCGSDEVDTSKDYVDKQEVFLFERREPKPGYADQASSSLQISRRVWST